ncbi:MAG: NADH-quinone oxidoreductase subunit D [Oligoflexia bacterium]|nr:NADH-quinone oxidoreductase subunit D [Oligoflexia bacterium]
MNLKHINQEIFNNQIKEQVKEQDLNITFDLASQPILWINTNIIPDLLKKFDLHFNYLTDLTCYDNVDKADGNKRFILVYQLYSLENDIRLRIKLPVDEGEVVPSLSSIYLSANWLEREVFDLYGITFSSHPDLRRIMMDERFIGHPLRKEYPLKQRMQFADNIKINLDRSPTDPNKNDKNANKENDPLLNLYNPEILLNLGPSHPAMHGTLRVMCRLDGENIEDLKCELGYLHRGIEKLGENLTYHQWIVHTDRLNYCSALNNNIAYVMTVEKLLSINVPERSIWIRIICMEISRIIDHLVCIAINALDMGAMTIFWHLYHWREVAYTMIEGLCGMRLTTTYARIGGMSYDTYDGFEEHLQDFCEKLPKALDEVQNLLSNNRIWIDRTKGVGVLTKEQALTLSASGPILRASGVPFDLRRDFPYYFYPDLKFDVVVGSAGDVYDRYLVRMEEVKQSILILKQSLKELKKLKGAPIWTDVPQIAIPDKKDVYSKMEVLIHHFKIFMEGINVSKGEVYNSVEGPNGELGFYIVSRGGPKAWRMRIKSPSFLHFQLAEHMLKNEKIPDAIAIIGSLNIIAGEMDR